MQTDPLLESLFPQLQAAGYQVTISQARRYNCIAWAAGDSTQWWEPAHIRGYYWPPGAELSYTLQAYIQAFEAQGFLLCDNAELEAGYEKIAIYVDADGIPTHAARQLEVGVWTSKLGMLEDIEHNTLAAVEGEHYGMASTFLRRSRGDV